MGKSTWWVIKYCGNQKVHYHNLPNKKDVDKLIDELTKNKNVEEFEVSEITKYTKIKKKNK